MAPKDAIRVALVVPLGIKKFELVSTPPFATNKSLVAAVIYIGILALPDLKKFIVDPGTYCPLDILGRVIVKLLAFVFVMLYELYNGYVNVVSDVMVVDWFKYTFE